MAKSQIPKLNNNKKALNKLNPIMKKEKLNEKKRLVQESESQIPSLPEDVIMEHIMPKLPIKPLMRLRCVSKTWLSTISSPQFAKSHFKSFSSSSPHHFLLFSSNCQVSDHPLFTSVTLDQHGRVQQTASLNFTHKGGVPINVVGCYDGLVCFYDPQSNFTVCNPVTRQCNDIPIISSGHMMAAGFYYVCSSDDYKIVRFTRNDAGNVVNEQVGMVVYVFSLRTRQWETLANVDGLPIARFDVPALVDDTIYWYNAQANVVVGLNLVSGDFHTIPSPYSDSYLDMINLVHVKRVKVFGIKGRLSLYFTGQVWVLDRNGSSWTKWYDLNCEGMRLLCVCPKTGNWLVLNNGLLALLNPSKSFYRQYQGGTRFNGPIFNFWNFKMSLCSPFMD